MRREWPVRGQVADLVVTGAAAVCVVGGKLLGIAFSSAAANPDLLGWALIVLPSAFSVVSAALDRLDPAYEQVASSLGARRMRVLLRVRLPLLLPSISASAGLALALSMGEVGATIMLYPPDWRTLPVTIFAQTDRGEVFLASASTVVLLALLALLTGLTGLSRKA